MECTYQPPTKISIGGHILSRDNYHDLYDRSCSCSQLYHQAKRSHLGLLVSSIEQTVGAYPMPPNPPPPSLCRVSDRSTAIVVCYLAPFRALFTRQARPLRILENSDDSRKPVVPKTSPVFRLFEVWASSQLTYMQPRRDQETYAALFRLNPKRQ